MSTDLQSTVLKLAQNALKQSRAEPPAPADQKKPLLSTGQAMLLGAGLATAGRALATARARNMAGSLRDWLDEHSDHEEPADHDDDEGYDDDEYDEPEAEDEGDFDDEEYDEPEAEDEGDADDEEYDEPEAEEDSDDEEYEDEEPEEEPERRPRRRRRSSVRS